MLVSMLRRKAASAGGEMIEINTRTTRLSQFDHTAGEYIEKPLSQGEKDSRKRLHVFGDGKTEPVQRDLYSAFLATCCSSDTLDIRQVQEAWPTAQSLLRRAMSRNDQPTSGQGFALPRVRKSVRVGRPSKRDAAQARPGML
jgi:putative transposase